MIVPAIIMFAISLLCIFIGVRQLAGKGHLFNNAWIWASDTERRELDEHKALKMAYYRQSGTVFLILAAFWLMIGISVLLENSVPLYLSYIAVIAAVIYAAVSHRAIENRKRESVEDRETL